MPNLQCLLLLIFLSYCNAIPIVLPQLDSAFWAFVWFQDFGTKIVSPPSEAIAPLSKLSKRHPCAAVLNKHY